MQGRLWQHTHHCPDEESPDSIGWFPRVALSFITSEYESGLEMQVIAGPKPSGLTLPRGDGCSRSSGPQDAGAVFRMSFSWHMPRVGTWMGGDLWAGLMRGIFGIGSD